MNLHLMNTIHLVAYTCGQTCADCGERERGMELKRTAVFAAQLQPDIRCVFGALSECDVAIL
jgi:hypothetical protein